MFLDATRGRAENVNIDPKLAGTDAELEEAVRLMMSGNKDSEELKRARERSDKFRDEMRAKYTREKNELMNNCREAAQG